MTLKNDQPVEHVAFIVAECNRLSDLGRGIFKQLPEIEALHSLPHPSGRGSMICGRAAARCLGDLANEAGRRAGLSGRVAHRTLREPVERLLVQRFFKEKRDQSRSQIDRLLATVGREARSKCEDITHFIPCTLMTPHQLECLPLGPVVFLARARFRRRMLEHVKLYGSDLDDEDRRYSRQLMADAAKFYRQFSWIAEVKVSGCDVETSQKIAERAVTSALDSLHLVFRAQFSRRMRVGGPPPKVDRRAGVTIGADGRMRPHGSTSWPGPVNFPADWPSWLEDPRLSHVLSLCGLSLEAAVNPDLARPVSRRFLDAAQWFGEASREDRAATCVIKYVTALERMVVTNEVDDIAKLVSERVAALCCDAGNAADREKWRKDTRKIYNLRSRLVHGSISPGDPDIDAAVWTAARICEQALLNALNALGADGLRAEAVSQRRLARWFSGVVTTIDELEASAIVRDGVDQA